MNLGYRIRFGKIQSCLGLGELEGVIKEGAVSSGGRLDILLKNPLDDTMYEVETMLGDTDPDHIVRTIEYWDLVRRKWPQRQHFAVLIAERITKRFFNVIRLLSDTVPLIAIQVNVIESPHGQSLSFHQDSGCLRGAGRRDTHRQWNVRRNVLA